ncbi:hypothetical protein I302_107515 [Kwoniella bestiolae CBS 10118]|uniref:Copper-fist domain-containing protein n=1 Tax=Kwoniella bestiolae CBS 10118 TaxID=1296100 RepID=A0A1B9FYC9_9TREE|nr:hypothetical protein I302_06744 [Kwoniella bestiolae CBS 10118]OCF23760.1 hypothetical protein I302_06744 [Kwoniella bestiolae CBS 10118]
MVLINEKKYACEKCIKGHRVSGCTHTDRPLYEIKKKGRPSTQCSCCKDRRKVAGSSVHNKCICGDTRSTATPSIIPPTSNPVEPTSSTQGSDQDQENEPQIVEVETRKGQPGSKATFPRGFKDVLELAAAANTLTGLLKDDSSYRVAERSVSALLNPCKCESGGLCKCCLPKKNSSASTNGESSSGGGTITPGGTIPRPSPPLMVNPHLSPENMHHPVHTSPHVHKTKLFSPYSANPARHGRRDTVTSNSGRASPLPKSLRPPPPRIKPLTDFGRLIGAAINQDGSINSEIPRSAVGLPNIPLPGISTFDTAAENGGAKVEPMEYEDIDIDMPLAFPTSEDVVIGACMCGEDCSCPGCATHDNGTPTLNENGSEHNHAKGNGCGEGCKGRHDCNHHIAVPSGVTSIAQLISLAASHVPPPPETNVTSLDPHDIRVLPPSVQVNEDVARTMGIVQLRPLECCNGRCQCPPGECTCEKECCGCCVRCSCSEDDEDARMGDDDPHPSEQPKSSCCSGKVNDPPALETTSRVPSSINLPSSNTFQSQPSPTLLSPPDISHPSRQPSPASSGTTTPVNGRPACNGSTSVRRSTSISTKSAQAKEGHDVSSSSHRRATVTGNPPAIAVAGPSKSATKAIAPYNSQHHRAILPKPSSSHLAVNTAVTTSNGSRQASPSGQKRGSISAGPTRSGSPSNNGETRSSGSNGNATKSRSSVSVSGQQNQSSLPAPIPQHAQPQLPLASFQWPPQVQQIYSQSLPHPTNQTLEAPRPTNYLDPQLYTQHPSVIPQELDLDPFVGCIAAYVHHAARAQNQPSPAQPPVQAHPQVQVQPQNQPPSHPPPQFDESWFNQIQQQPAPALSHDISGSGDTSPELDQPFDLEQFISQALASQSQQQQESSQPTMAEFADYLMNNSLPSNGYESYDQHAQVRSNPQGYDTSQAVPPFVPLVPGLPADADYAPNWTSAGVKNQQVEDGRQGLKDIYQHQLQHNQPSYDPQQSGATHDQRQTQTSVQQLIQQQLDNSGSANTLGDIIDLSKPLDSDSLNKIMKALQKHSEQLGSADPSTSTSASGNIPVNGNEDMTSNSSVTHLNAVDVPFPNGTTVNGNTKDLDDMFNQFVTLDSMTTAGGGQPNLGGLGANGDWIDPNDGSDVDQNGVMMKFFGLG